MKSIFNKDKNRNDLLIAFCALPLYAAGVARYGYKQAVLLVVCLITGLIIETLGYRLRKKKSGGFDFVSWILFPLVLPPAFPLFMSVICFGCGVVIATVFFGGHGRQITAPVAVGWAFAVASFTNNFRLGWTLPLGGFSEGFTRFSTSFFITEHPLDYFGGFAPVPPLELLLGNFPQSVSGAIPLVTIVCGLILVLLRGVDFRVTFSFLLSLVGLTFLVSLVAPGSLYPLSSLLIGNSIFVAFFILPNRRTASRIGKGRWIIGFLAGATAFLIKSFSDFPDGVLFAVVFANVFTPIIDEGIISLRYRKLNA